MSAATAAVIVLGADYGLTAGLLAWFADRHLTRQRATATPRTPAPARGGYTAGDLDVTQFPLPPAAMTVPAMTSRPLPPQTAQRQEAYNKLRDEGKTRDEAGAELEMAPRTARDYEARRMAMLAAQNGAPS